MDLLRECSECVKLLRKEGNNLNVVENKLTDIYQSYHGGSNNEEIAGIAR